MEDHFFQLSRTNAAGTTLQCQLLMTLLQNINNGLIIHFFLFCESFPTNNRAYL